MSKASMYSRSLILIMPNEHAMHAFRSLVQMFPGVDLQLNDSRYTGTIPLDKNIPDGDLPLGLSPCEEKNLARELQKVEHSRQTALP
ncbi:MAG TPA: hypothetical protein VFF39_14655 [Verrucomicrobiae bacterium]|nr:hypothetical protein [Verrucomicrobiae bacterium]